MAEVIQAQDVSFFYENKGRRRTDALRNVSLRVREKELLSVVGPSGCGKSTLLKLLSGLLEPSAGTITKTALADSTSAYIAQASSLLPWRTLLQNACLGLELRGRLNETTVEQVMRAIAEYGLRGFEDYMAEALSGGMQQRVAILRALVSEPRLLFCDEPFSAIDFVTRLRLNGVFKRMCQVYGITTVFVTHNIEEAIFLGDRIVVLSAHPGRVVAEYTPDLPAAVAHDAVRCRETSQFTTLFNQIWNDLQVAHDS
jgi:NitT/TauT family transport system ATP-binding protein